MTDIDLTFAKDQVEQLMTDTCRITRNARGTANAPIDDSTGRLADTPPVIVYEGKCKIKPEFTPVPSSEGGQQTVAYRYELSIPIPTTPDGEPMNGDEAIILSSLRDPGLVNMRIHIGEGIEYKTFALQRKMHGEVRQKIGDRP